MIVCTEYTTRWVEAGGIPGKSATTVTNGIFELIITRYGCPESILTDQGPEFVNEMNLIMCKEFSIKRRLCSPYHPQTNGLTERCNQTLINVLTKYVNSQKNNWDKLIKWALMSYRANKQASTKYSPFFLLVGKQIRLPIENDIDPLDNTHESEYGIEEEIDQRLQSLLQKESANANSKLNLQSAQNKQKEQYDAKHASLTYQVGDIVWYKNRRKSQRKGGKLEFNWVGTREIETNLGNGAYKLKGIKRTYNATQLKPSSRTGKNTEQNEILESDHKRFKLDSEDTLEHHKATIETWNSSFMAVSNKAEEDPEAVLFVKESKSPINYLFLPPDEKWQKEICNELAIPFKKVSSLQGRTNYPIFTPHANPTRVKLIEGDGNCLFRALGYVVSGSEDCHMQIRDSICNLIEEKGDVDYLKRTKMRQDKVWGTTGEIFAASELFQIPIFTYHKVGNRFTWSQHRGPKVTKNHNYKHAIFLENRSGIHFNVVQRIGKTYILAQ